MIGKSLTNSPFSVATLRRQTTDSTALQDHIDNTSNPHTVTKEQVELGNVDNTSDVDKPISTAQSNALALKQDKLDDFTGSITVVTSVDFATETVTTATLDFSNGVLISVT